MLCAVLMNAMTITTLVLGGGGAERLQTAELFEHILAIQCSFLFLGISEFPDLMISSAIELDLVGSWDYWI